MFDAVGRMDTRRNETLDRIPKIPCGAPHSMTRTRCCVSGELVTPSIRLRLRTAAGSGTGVAPIPVLVDEPAKRTRVHRRRRAAAATPHAAVVGVVGADAPWTIAAPADAVWLAV